jgi:hypothetical protein
MAFEDELHVFLRRTAEGAYRLESEDGRLVLQSPTYRDLRSDLATLMGTSLIPGRVKIFIGLRRQLPAAVRTDLCAELRS